MTWGLRTDYDRPDGSARHARGGRVPGRAALVARGEPPRGDAGPPRRGGALRRAGDARVEPCALRRRLRRPHVARGVRRRRRAVHAPGDLPRGAGARRGAAAHRRHRDRDGRADDHRARHRGAEGALPRAAPLRRGDLVPGLLRARRRLRPRRRADELDARRRATSSSTARRCGRRSRTSPTSASSLTRTDPELEPPRGAHVPHRRHARARRRGAAAPADHRRGGVQRDLLLRRSCPGREPPRRGRRRLAGRDDDAPARARHARLRAAGRARGADPQARLARTRPRRRPASARPRSRASGSRCRRCASRTTARSRRS